MAEHYLENGAWPTGDSGLGVRNRADYLDGHNNELEDDGVSRLRFTVLPSIRGDAPIRAGIQIGYK